MTAPQPDQFSPAWWNAQAQGARTGRLYQIDIETLAGVSLTDPNGGAWFFNMDTKLPSFYAAMMAGALYFTWDDQGGGYFSSNVGYKAPGATDPWAPDLATTVDAPQPPAAAVEPPPPPPEPYHVKGHTPHHKKGS